MPNKARKINFIFFIYWFLLTYIIAALVWWFISLAKQNEQMAAYQLNQLQPGTELSQVQAQQIQQLEKRKKAQYIGEGVTFFLLIIAGAAFVFRAVRRQLRQSMEQQHFLMALTHELKTPIAVTKLNLETLQKRKLEETQQQKLIQNTLQEANRLNTLCNNMLLSSQIEARGFSITNEEIDLSALVQECVNDFKTRFSQRTINSLIAADIYTEGDTLLLQMAVNNLIDNAIKYTPKETAITVTLEEQNHLITLQVKDEGKGIDDTEKKKIFQKFYRTGNAATKGARGTGLGLYLTRRIAEQHNANISVTDNHPSGSIFVITLHASVLKN
ncbi:MAG: HAMP domain-containing histidine kinase [Bacteroidetes bacterium]|nr:HAMP domain-containing histidine kinase [Bacteroidota bacterium]